MDLVESDSIIAVQFFHHLNIMDLLFQMKPRRHRTNPCMAYIK